MDDDTSFADGLDTLDGEADPTARGIVQGLQILALEASSLGLQRTLDALQAAIRACVAEGEDTDDADDADEAGGFRISIAGSSRIH